MSELRKDPITRRWVIISTERGKRPHDFKTEPVHAQTKFCPFDPGNEQFVPKEIYAVRQPGSKPNDPNWSLRVVPNKFPALRIEGELDKRGFGIYDMMNGIGAHEVIIETPIHTETIDIMTHKQVKDIVEAYKIRILDLEKDKRMKYVLVFKNFGSQAGASLEHSHSQLVALPILPKRIIEKAEGSKKYFDYKERCIMCDIINQEKYENKRTVEENDNFITIEPFAARFPFETWIIPKEHCAHYELNNSDYYDSFARILQNTIKRISIALDNPPYNFILLNAPFTKEYDVYFHWHLEIIPRLTKIAGFEWGSGFYINPTPPENAAKFLKEASLEGE